jgi:hypothetical protein
MRIRSAAETKAKQEQQRTFTFQKKAVAEWLQPCVFLPRHILTHPG